MNAYQFFLRHAGYSYDPKRETKMQGRIRCAQALARAEREARNAGIAFQWEVDQTCDSSEFSDDREPWQLWTCCAFSDAGLPVASCGGIDFGRDGSPWSDPYRRVMEAELALEVMEESAAFRVRTGT